MYSWQALKNKHQSVVYSVPSVKKYCQCILFQLPLYFIVNSQFFLFFSFWSPLWIPLIAQPPLHVISFLRGKKKMRRRRKRSSQSRFLCSNAPLHIYMKFSIATTSFSFFEVWTSSEVHARSGLSWLFKNSNHARTQSHTLQHA